MVPGASRNGQSLVRQFTPITHPLMEKCSGDTPCHSIPQPDWSYFFCPLWSLSALCPSRCVRLPNLSHPFAYVPYTTHSEPPCRCPGDPQSPQAWKTASWLQSLPPRSAKCGCCLGNPPYTGAPAPPRKTLFSTGPPFTPRNSQTDFHAGSFQGFELRLLLNIVFRNSLSTRGQHSTKCKRREGGSRSPSMHPFPETTILLVSELFTVSVSLWIHAPPLLK